jgi:hypothetical protein
MTAPDSAGAVRKLGPHDTDRIGWELPNLVLGNDGTNTGFPSSTLDPFHAKSVNRLIGAVGSDSTSASRVRYR